MGALGWLIVIGGPTACAAIGAVTAFLLTVRHYERRLDATYGAGWDDCLASAAAEWQGYAVQQWSAASARAVAALPAPEAATETLTALPALHHEGGRHARPERPAQGGTLDPAVARIRAEFDRIRLALGLGLRS